MSQHTKTTYAFPDRLPLGPIEQGTSLLVTEPTVGGRHKTALSLLDGSPSEGTLFITTGKTGSETVTLFERCGGTYDETRMAILDCSEGGTPDPTRNITTLQSPGDLTGVGMGFSAAYQELRADGFDNIRTGLYDLSTLILYAEDFRVINRFLHTMTGRIGRTGGLGVFVIDPETQDKQTIRSLEQTVDAGVDIRVVDADGETYELRTRGLPDQPPGWQQFSL